MSPKISLYPFLKETKKSKEITIDEFFDRVRDGHWQDPILQLRRLQPGPEYDKAKDSLPYVTISGNFIERNNKGINKHSGFICMDIDKLYETVLDVKSELCCDNYFHAVFLSCSGTGLCAVAKINPKAHLESFNFLSEHLFEKYGLNCDEKCKDVSRPRYVSYDPDIYINPTSQLCPVNPIAKTHKKPINTNYVFAEDDFNHIVKQVEAKRLDLTADYDNWVKCGFALVNKFGEVGRSYFHALSQFNSGYNQAKTNKKFDHLLKTTDGKISIGFIYYLAKQNGLSLYSEKTETIIRETRAAKKTGIDVKTELAKVLTTEEIDSAAPLIAQVENEKVSGSDDNLILEIKTFIKQNYNLKHNIITRNIELDGTPINDRVINSIFVKARTHINKATKDLVCSILFSEFVQDYNPFSDLITHYAINPPQNIHGHIELLIDSIETDTPNHRLFIKKWLVSIAGSLRGKHSPLMLVFCGEQHRGKTPWFRQLLPVSLLPYYAESKLDAGKDDEILMTKKIIIMDDEMGGKSKQEQKKLKELTSRQTFSIREPYGRVSMDLQRLAVLCGTTNDEEILNDPTGNCRILPVRVLSVNWDIYNSVDKDLVFFELMWEYDNGYDCTLSLDEIKLLNEGTEEFRSYSKEEDLLMRFFGRQEDWPGCPYVEITPTDMCEKIKAKTNIEINTTRLGLILKKMGLGEPPYKSHKKVGKSTIRIYRVVEIPEKQ
jgi:predicted P-loop ATPase